MTDPQNQTTTLANKTKQKKQIEKKKPLEYETEK